MDDDATVTLGDGDPDLAARLSEELHEFNTRATGVDDQRGLSVQVRDAAGDLVAGLSGWTWGSCAGIELVWVRQDQRRSGHGARLLAAVEEEARGRGCAQIVVSSFTFQAPGSTSGTATPSSAARRGCRPPATRTCTWSRR